MKVTLNKEGIAINGRHEALLCASLFYFRLPKETWQNRINMLVATGYNTVDVYFPWNFHEVSRGEWDFSGDKDADAFLKMLSDAGLYVVARPGPYICSEWDGGALPTWINEEYNIRRADEAFLAEVDKWYDRILPIIKKYEYNGCGGVILVQLDNELDFFDCPDPQAYIGALKSMALARNITAPLFCCAGQLNAFRAGGFTEGVVPTYNFYPNSLDNTYDGIFRFYNNALLKKDLPFLITETNRDHFLLRREFASGAKLLGAYNQVAGTNFGFTASINNWGKPLSYLAADYDFDSMITSMGEYSAEAKKAKVFAAYLKTMGDRAAKALAYNGDIEFKADNNMITSLKLNALESPDGGVIVCCPNFSEIAGTIAVTVNGQTLSLTVQPKSAPFIMFNVTFDGVKITANCEPYSYTDNTLTFVKNSDSQVMMSKDGKLSELSADGEAFGLKICFISRIDAEKIDGYGFSDDIHTVKNIEECVVAEAKLDFKKATCGKDFNFTALNLNRGYAEYTVEAEKNKEIFLEDAADIIRAEIDGKYFDTRIGLGSCEIYPASHSGQAIFTVEKWGHSNFDDARFKCMRIASLKGIKNAFSVMEKTPLSYSEFSLLDEFGADSLPKSTEEIPALIKISQWNTTRVPVVCAYKFLGTRKYDKLYLRLKSDIECIVYLNGKKVDRADYGYVDLSANPKGEECEITLVFRKLNWAADCGSAELLQLKAAKIDVSIFSEEDMAKIRLTSKGQEQASLPVSLSKGKRYRIGVNIPQSKHLAVQALLKDAKATFMCGGKVIARIMGDWEQSPAIVGGAKDKFYLPACWNEGNLIIYVEALGENPQLNSLTATEILGQK